MLHTIRNFVFYIGFFLFVTGIFNVLFDLIPEYQLTITYISYVGLYMMLVGTAYPPNKSNKKGIEEIVEEKIEEDFDKKE